MTIYIDEGQTGKNITRPAFQRMMLAAEQRIVQRIVAVKLDRLARNTRDFLATVDRLRRYDCDLVLLAELSMSIRNGHRIESPEM